MTHTQAISEINKIITQLPDNVLEDLLSHLRKIEKTMKKGTNDNGLVNKIFEEDKSLLQKLAK